MKVPGGLFGASVTVRLLAQSGGRVAYRIVQEALTNVIRHAAGAAAQVTVAEQRGQLVVDVVDDGRGRDGPFVEGTGSRLVGMGERERARALGGHFEAGPAVPGGSCVHAELPVGPRSHAEEPTASTTSLGS